MSALTDATPGNPNGDQPPADAPVPADPPPAAPPAGARPDGQAIAAQPTIPVSLLTAHPGNVRRDLDLNPDFQASIEANGVLVPLRVTSGADGAFRVIDGHRRLAAAVKAGLTEVPADLAGDRAGDEPGQFLDMWTAHRHRNPLTPIEEADALFAAREAGATKARIRKSTGLNPPEINTALAAARLSEQTRAAVEAAPRDLTLEDLAVIAEFEGDPDAIAKLLDAARWAGTLDHLAQQLRQERADKTEHERLRREFEDAGTAVTEALPPDGQLLAALGHDGEEITPASHSGCPGRGVFFRSYDPTTPVHYCADPAAYGHAFQRGGPEAAPGEGTTGRPGLTGEPDPGPPDANRRLVIEGNKAWKAASEVRKRWLGTHLFPRRTVSRQAAQFVAQQLLSMPDPLRSGLAAAHSRLLFSEITGHPAATWQGACETAAAGRLPLLMLAPIVTAYEQAMTEGEGKNTWRADRYSPCPRDEAGRYLIFLASLGYQLSGIEQVIADGAPYTGHSPPTDALPGSVDGEPVSRPGGVSDDGESGPGGTETVAEDAHPASPGGRPDSTANPAA